LQGPDIYEKALRAADYLADMRVIASADLELFGYFALNSYEEAGAGELDRGFSTEGAEPAGQS
jgi:hypothetical protein